MLKTKKRKKKRIDYKDFLEMLRNIASHFCTAKVIYKKMLIFKKQDPISEILYPDANIVIAGYNPKLNQIWVNKRRAVIDLFAKRPENFLHEIYHAKHKPLKPKKWTAVDVLKMKTKEEDDASRWAKKKIEYYAKNPEKWKKLLIEKGKYWKK